MNVTIGDLVHFLSRMNPSLQVKWGKPSDEKDRIILKQVDGCVILYLEEK